MPTHDSILINKICYMKQTRSIVRPDKTRTCIPGRFSMNTCTFHTRISVERGKQNRSAP